MEATNPYAPPETAIVFDAPPVETDDDHEAVRREHLAAESTLKVMAWLSFLQSVETGVFFLIFMATRSLRDSEDMSFLLCFAIGGVIGVAISAWRNTRELLDLNPHQRRKHTLGMGIGALAWVSVPLLFPAIARFFLNTPLVLVLIVGSVFAATPLKLYAFWSRKASVVFSEHYRDVVVRWTSRKVRPGIAVLGWVLIALTLARMAGEVLLVLSVLVR